ncbi:MAG: DUF4288 domain-containing protein [Sphingobacteriales bacterium]|nr:MAG: DUF4288 domain-containing protein [Sphingobacteriales bacterium]
MNWYLAKIVYRIICGNGEHTAQFDEQLRLIAADNEETAFEKAQQVGQKEQDCFANVNQEMVQWKFINVAELYKLQELIDGAEVYSMIKETGDAHSYIQFIDEKANHIRQRTTHQILQLL